MSSIHDGRVVSFIAAVTDSGSITHRVGCRRQHGSTRSLRTVKATSATRTMWT